MPIEKIRKRPSKSREHHSLFMIGVRDLEGSYRLFNSPARDRENRIRPLRYSENESPGNQQPSRNHSLCLSGCTSDRCCVTNMSSLRMKHYSKEIYNKQNLTDREHIQPIDINCPTILRNKKSPFPFVRTYFNQENPRIRYYLTTTSASRVISRQQLQVVEHQPPQDIKLDKTHFFTAKKQEYSSSPSSYFQCLAKLLILCHLMNLNSWSVFYNYPLNQKSSMSFLVMADEVGIRDRADESYLQYNPLDRILNQDLTLESGPDGEKLPDRTPLDFIKHTHHHHSHRSTHHSNSNAKHNAKHHHRTSEDQQRSRRHNHHSDYYSAADRPLVRTKKGLVRGITQKSFTGKFVDAFLGIPFAQPPNGTYRFKHPQPNQPWTGELDASRLASSCYQVNDTFFGANFLGTSIWNANTPLSEDCLYLNIWTPFGAANMTVPSDSSSSGGSTRASGYRSTGSGDRSQQQTDQKRPVLVWIFGGGFYSGTSSLAIYEGGVLASEEDIIVVSMNYRVSALGFLYFGRPDAPGNAGMFDQLLALQWISDNINQFGGDPERVTIFGESAGAVSVALHLLSPLSRNLFSQAILQSGAATCPWGSKDAHEIIANGLQLASLLNCPSTNPPDFDAVLACLQKADPMALVSQEVGQTKTILNFPFVPVVDGSFLIEPPSESLLKSNFKHTRILLGSNNDEGNAWLIYLPEFSHCPTGSSGGGGGGPDLARPPQQEQPRRPVAGDELMSNTGANGDNGESSNQLVELSDQARRESPIESLDLVSASGRHHHQQQQYGEQQSSPQERRSNGLPEDHPNEGDSQNQLNDSKPCKPNDFPSLTREDFLRVLKEDLNPYAEHPIGKEAIVFEYSNWNNPLDSVSNYDALDKIVGDYYFTCHVNELAHRYALAGNPVYMYYFRQRSSMSPWPKWMGVLHADEINFVFGEPLNQMYNYTPKEVDLSRRMMKYWANFAKFG